MKRKNKEQRKIISCKLKRGKSKKTAKGIVTPFTAHFQVIAPKAVKESKITGPKWTRTPYPPDREWDVIDF